MKVLHTSDWHLGQKFLYNDREEEHRLALGWLLETIEKHEVDLLLVAGDLFDIGNPPNYARRLYYSFLTRLIRTCCRQVVIIAGNHDSPAMLNAPGELLAALNIHIVSAAAETPQEELIEVQDEKHHLRAVVAAVPFLRDADLRFSVAGEGGTERMERIRKGILDHYRQVGEAAQRYRKAGVPVMATGHLYATGAETGGKQDNIYIGDVENIKADQFPEVFHYVALGHIHRPQAVGGRENVRYSGSLIPLSFSETQDEKKVVLLDFDGPELREIREVPVPVFRRLKTIQGNLEQVEERLVRFGEKGDRGLTPWVEVIVESEEVIPQLDVRLRELTREMDLELLKIRIQHTRRSLDVQVETEELGDLDALEVFRKKCTGFGSPPAEMEELERTFLELQTWMEETEPENL